MATYWLRSKTGDLKAKLPGRIAGRVTDGTAGFFRKAKYTDGKVKTVFEITDGCVLEFADTELFLWEGDTLVPTD